MTLFILGIERSATTWVSNILEAHPSTEVFMEPMSIYHTRFHEWPNRFEKITNTEKMCQYFCQEMEILRKRKRWALTKLSERSIAWNLDLTVAEFLIQKKLANDHIKDFYELNFHRKNSFCTYLKSSDRIDVIKCLRLNFNAPIIRKIDPEAKVIVIIRDLASTIFSIQNQIKAGNLSELKKLMEKKYDEINLNSLFEYWKQSYNSLLTGLDESNTPYHICKHPYLLENMNQFIRELIKFTGLSANDSVNRYFEESNRAGIGLHSTNRDHSALIHKAELAQKKLSSDLKDQIRKSNFHPALLDLVKCE